jgi:N-acetylneuraminic acid mutarotase
MSNIQNDWSKIPETNETPSPRTKFTAVMWTNPITKKDKMIIFGGGYHKTFLDELFEYDIETNKWKLLMKTGDVQNAPSGRRTHSCTLFKNKLIIFGGRMSSGRLNDFYEFHLITHEWRCLHTNDYNLEQTFNAINNYDNLQLFIKKNCYFSNKIFLNNEILNDIIPLEKNITKWVSPRVLDKQNQLLIIKKKDIYTKLKKDLHDVYFELLNTMPESSAGSTMCCYKNRWIIINGGDTVTENYYSNNTCIFDYNEFSWETITPDNSTPIGRLGHSAVIYENEMYIFGGYGGHGLSDIHVFNLETKKWKEIKYNCNIAPSSFHSATIHRHNMVLMGGNTNKNKLQNTHDSTDLKYLYNDMKIFNLIKKEWLPVEENTETNDVQCYDRLGHVLLTRKNELYLFGGSNEEYYNDHYVLHVEPSSLKNLLREYIIKKNINY